MPTDHVSNVARPLPPIDLRHRAYRKCETVQMGPYIRLIRDEDDNVLVWLYPFDCNEPMAVIKPDQQERWIEFLRPRLKRGRNGKKNGHG